MKETPKEDLISTKDASRASGYNADYLSRLCRAGKIAGRQEGRSWLVERASLESFVATQIDRKIELAEALAREREEEYRRANRGVRARSRALQRETFRAANSLVGALARTRLPRVTMSHFTGPSFATVMTALVLAGSVSLAGSGAVPRAGGLFADAAFGTRALVIETVTQVQQVAYEKNAATLANASKEIKALQPGSMPANEMPVDRTMRELHARMEHAHGPVDPYALARTRASAVVTSMPAPESAAAFAQDVTRAVSDPSETVSSLARASIAAYVMTGESMLDAIEGAQFAQERMTVSAGESLLAFSDAALVAGIETPLAWRSLTDGVLDAYVKGVYAFVDVSQDVPPILLNTLYGAGDTIATTLGRGIYAAPSAYDRSIAALSEASRGTSDALASASYAFGAEASALVHGSLRAEDQAIARYVYVLEDGLYDAGRTSGMVFDAVPDLLRERTVALNAEAAERRIEEATLTASALSSDSEGLIAGGAEAARFLMELARLALDRLLVPFALLTDTARTHALASVSVPEFRVPCVELDLLAAEGSSDARSRLDLHENEMTAVTPVAGPYVLASAGTTSAFSHDIRAGRDSGSGTPARGSLAANAAADAALVEAEAYDLSSATRAARLTSIGIVLEEDGLRPVRERELSLALSDEEFADAPSRSFAEPYARTVSANPSGDHLKSLIRDQLLAGTSGTSSPGMPGSLTLEDPGPATIEADTSLLFEVVRPQKLLLRTETLSEAYAREKPALQPPSLRETALIRHQSGYLPL